jgi:hypothetical protein
MRYNDVTKKVELSVDGQPYDSVATGVGGGGGSVDSVSGGNKINVAGTATDPIVNQDDMPDGTIQGRQLGAGTGIPEDLTPAQARTLLNTDEVTGQRVPLNNSVSEAKILNNAVSNLKLADMAADTIKGRQTSPGSPDDLTAAQVRTILNVEERPFTDATALFKEDADNTKQLAFDLTQITTATTRTVVFPDKNIEVDAATDPRQPLNHAASSHSDGAADEISVENLATAGALGTVVTSDGAGGLTMAAPGAPGAHASTHENGGLDEIDVTGLSGALADPQTPSAHASAHEDGGADEISVAGRC